MERHKTENPLELAYPILCLARDHSIVALHDSSRLGECNVDVYLRNRFYEGLLIFDARGNGYRVTASTLSPRYTPWRYFLARLFSLSIRVELTLTELGPQNLELIKLRVLEWIDQDPDFWSSGEDLADLRSGIQAAHNVAEVVKRLEYASEERAA